MTAETLAAKFDASLFAPLRLQLRVGGVVEIQTPFLSFINPRGLLYVARAARPHSGLPLNVELIPVSEIEAVDQVQ
jgi:hypothetical protein